MSHKVVLASTNVGKLKELGALLKQVDLEVVSQRDFDIDDAVEDGLSFVENAIIKARHAAHLSGLPAIADDSGLEVDALEGAPGIYSARFAGSHGDDAANNQKLLDELKGIHKAQRTARFQCVMVYLRHAEDPVPIIAQGTWEGRILEAPQGDHGFGYDPLFWVEDHGCSSAELSKAQKNAISHRGKALNALLDAMKRRGLHG